MKQFALAAILAAVAATTVSAAEVASRKVTFPSNGETIVGTLYVPSTADTRRPGVIVAGAWTSIKEQMSGLYAKEMAERGFVALAFDYRGWGESSGTIRFKEDPAMKTADIIAAADFLSTLSQVDADAINGLGICASAGYMADAVSGNPRFRSLSLVAPWLHNKAIVEEVYGGAEGVAKLIAVSRSAERAEETGNPRVILAASATDEILPHVSDPLLHRSRSRSRSRI
ncbi:UNVERIFIED_ORG: dienelactone hydrolase [Rhizobium etli]